MTKFIVDDLVLVETDWKQILDAQSNSQTCLVDVDIVVDGIANVAAYYPDYILQKLVNILPPAPPRSIEIMAAIIVSGREVHPIRLKWSTPNHYAGSQSFVITGGDISLVIKATSLNAVVRVIDTTLSIINLD